MKFFKWLRLFNSVQWKMVLIYISLLLIAIQLIGVYFFQELEDFYVGDLEVRLKRQADLLISPGGMAKELAKPQLNSAEKRKRLNKLLQNIYILDKGSGQIVQLLDQDGVVLSTTAENKSKIGQKNPRVTSVLRGVNTNDTQFRRGPNNQPLILYSKAITENDQVIGAIYIEAPMKKTYDTIRTINNKLLQISLFSLVGTAILGIILARTITNPVKEITEQASEMALGDFHRKVAVKSNDEIGQLAAAFNHLAQHLREALSQNEEEKGKLESVLTNMNDGVIATDDRGCVIVINQRAGNILGRTIAKGDPITQALPLSEPLPFPLVEERQAYLELNREDEDEPTVVKITFTPIRRSEETVGLITVLQDVTEENKLDRQRKEFVANVSHELRTPLTTIKSYLEALDEGGAMEDPELAKRFLRVTRQESERMTRLIHDLLQLSRLDAQKVRFNRQPVAIEEILSDAVERFSISAEQKNIDISFRFNDHLPKIYGDRDQLDQVLDNLISNAVKYTPEERSITVSARRRSDGFVVVAVSDRGIGIPQKDLALIFERFYRVDKARSRNMGGTGLGLAIAREIIEAHGGSIDIDSRYGWGTTVHFTLPPYVPEVIR
ncbi:two-component system, OmpR family, sensor histidine kinase VicK [Marininema mesophilum]|uniref:histidine kinase n=1 Tax=Marininema mesophilum TaxID=1048340 RepID=A0A1H3AII2_9BACL|nr:ATP-binding protein [Marininema mesophilum]SDX29530.1 two-component system, OmpR family, sensor histidine kinase VicK [Marininema mesophilum]